MKRIQTDDGKSVDPTALLILTYQVRNLLRFHQNMGLAGYPGHSGFAGLFPGRNGADMVFPAAGDGKNRKMAADKPETTQKTAISLSLVQEEIKKCNRCHLAENRLGQVAGIGLQGAKLMVVGDWSHQKDNFSPRILMGREEDTMFWRMMAAIGQAREEVFVTNVVKCCPAGDDIDADNEPVFSCTDHLEREIASVQPTVILAMGVVAAHALVVDGDAPLVRLRGRFYPCRRQGCESIRVMVSFHPCFLVSNPEMKKIAWQDLQMVQRQLSISTGGKYSARAR